MAISYGRVISKLLELSIIRAMKNHEALEGSALLDRRRGNFVLVRTQIGALVRRVDLRPKCSTASHMSCAV